MKLTIKKTLCVCILMCLSILLLEMLRVRLPFTQPVLGTSTTTARQMLTNNSTSQKPFNCSMDYRDSLVSEKVVPAEVKKMSPENLKIFIDQYEKNCIRNTNSNSVDQTTATTLAMHFGPVFFENHFLVYSPRIAIEMKKVRSHIPMCPAVSPLLRGHINVSVKHQPELKYDNGKYYNWPMSFEEIAWTHPNLFLGGFHSGPRNCKCRSLNAIIVPYRNREKHLRYFLYYIHQLLQRQQLCYVVIVAEQADENVFNKGQLMNTAYRYAKETSSFDCYIFHDVDIIAEDDRILYACRSNKITHLAPYVDKFQYKFAASLTVGAVVGFTAEQYELVNGYSNEFAGWGGEDDDMMLRIKSKQLKVWRSTQNYTRFKMIKHGADLGNARNSQRFKRLHISRKRAKMDGFNSIDTELVETIFFKTHTRLKIKTYKTFLHAELKNISFKKLRKKAARVSRKKQAYTPKPVVTDAIEIPIQTRSNATTNSTPR